MSQSLIHHVNTDFTTKYFSGNQMKDEMGGICDTLGGKEKYTQGFGGET
jgi:hypothetical protein